MSVKDITGLMTILPDRENQNQSLKEEMQAGNIAFRSRALVRALLFWNNNNAGTNYQIYSHPWKMGGLLDDNDINVGHSLWQRANVTGYPGSIAASATQMSTFDYTRFRATGTVGTVASSQISRVHGSLVALDGSAAIADVQCWNNCIVSSSDIPTDYTQIGIVYAHPTYIASTSVNATFTTVVGQNWVTITNGGLWDQPYVFPAKWGVIRIGAGADAGMYLVQNVDFTNNRLYLRNLNGTSFSAQASATIAATDIYLGPGRTAYFNEVSIIPFSTGSLSTSGRFVPGFYPGTSQALRSSFIAKIKIEKTGSTEVAAAAEQQGSYYVIMKPWTHGDYDSDNYDFAFYLATFNEGGGSAFYGHTYPYSNTAATISGANGIVLDETNARCWFGISNVNGDSCIMQWRWRTCESPREVANYLGTAGHASFVTPSPVLASGDKIRGTTLGSNRWVYFPVQHSTLGNGGLIIIKSDSLTSLQYTKAIATAAWTGAGDAIGGTAPSMTLTDAGATFSAGQVGQSITIAGATTSANNGTFVITGYTSATQITYQNLVGVAEAYTGTWNVLGVPDTNVGAAVPDKTRTRTGTAGDVTTTSATNQVNSASGAFTAADIGRVIQLAGGTNNNGVYKIATVPSGTQVTVTTLADAAVSFSAGGSGGTFQIGDRLYMFYNNASNGVGKINYMETLAPGTFLTRTVSMTNGATVIIQYGPGENQKAVVDPANGNVYWLSSDTQQQLNKYDPLTNTHSFLAPVTNTTMLSPLGGVVSSGATPATNPGTPTILLGLHVNSKFNEIWLGTDQGHFKLPKDQPFAGFSGSGTTIGGTAPLMTLTSSGGGFTPEMVGRRITLSGATTGANNGTYLVAAYVSGTQIKYKNTAGVAEAFSGTWAMELVSWRYWGNDGTAYVSGVPLTIAVGNGSSGLTFSTPNVTLNVTGTPFVAGDVGKYIFITGATTAANNGMFPITAVNSSSSITYTNASGATQANFAGTVWVAASWATKSDGSNAAQSNSRISRGYWEAPDGRITVYQWAGTTANGDFATYSRESDTFLYGNTLGNSASFNGAGRNRVIDSVGWWMDFCPSAFGPATRMYFGSANITYQWIGSAWTPLEIAYSGTPNKSTSDTTNPLCQCRPIHSTAQDLMYGVKIQFNRQGGATPNNNEFLGRMGQTRTTSSDGATTLGAATFNGSGFVAGDAGRLLRIESGSDVGLYKINSFVNSGQLTLKNLNGVTFAALATAGTITYSVWDMGAVGSNAGPEEMTFILADGVSKDNTQDITGFTYEAYHFKTRLHENDENRKFCVENPLAAPGSLATKVYFENYPRQVAQYDAATSHHRALPASELANGRQALDGIMGKFMDGTVGHGVAYSNLGGTTAFNGILADSSVIGYSLMVDFGVDVQVGYAILRLHCFAESKLATTVTNNGLLGNIYKTNDAGGAPLASIQKSSTGNGTSGLAFSTPTVTLNSTGTPFVVGDVGKYIVITGATLAANNGVFLITAFNSSSSVSWSNASGVAQANYAGTWYVTPTANVRTSGTATFNCAANTATTTALTSGDFLGPITLTPSTAAVGAIVSGASTFADSTNAPFLSSHVGQVLKITAGAGADIGSYRIIGFTSSSIVTVRNLDQTSKAWTVTSSTVTYEVRDGVREEDMLVVANTGGIAHRLCVERLVTANTVQVRTAPDALCTNLSWICVKPTWDLVKRIAHSTEAVPPDVKNNGTWVGFDGRERYDFFDVKVYSDFSDLSSAARTGRFWKWTGLPRFAGDGSRADHEVSTWEFYDISGNRLATSSYTVLDESRTNADFLANNTNRVDFIQSANDAMSGVSGFNGNVGLGGASVDTLTLTTGGNKFLGFQIGIKMSDAVLAVGTNILDSAGSTFPAAASVGRFIRILTGANTGNIYRVASRDGVLATRITLTTPSGSSVSWGSSESSIQFTVHEGINVGGVSPDKIVFLSDNKEYTLASINDACTTMTIAESLTVARTNQTWEIRRPGYQTSSVTTEATKTARLVEPSLTYPVQTGDVCHDYKGCHRFFGEDIGTGFQRADGVIAGGSGAFAGSGFSSDDIGRLLYITSGTATQANNGIYEISGFTSSTSITVKNHYTGAAVSFTADGGPVTYQVLGDRRFRFTRFVIVLRA
jgi:hypothetical protein